MGELDDECTQCVSVPLAGRLDDIEVVIMYQMGHSDGYTHSYDPTLFKTYGGAKAESELLHGNYAIEPRGVSTITLYNGKTFIVDGPYKTADELVVEARARRVALEKLTPYERELLGVKPL